MNPNDPRVDRSIADALRAVAHDAYAGSFDALAARIDAAAAPLLSARRDGSTRPMAWWDYAAGWSRALIPASVIVAAASVGFLWLLRTAEAEPARQTSAIVAAVRPCLADRQTVSGECASTEVVNRAVEELVSTNDAPVRRPPR
jgi:hypothetical protein